MRYLVARRPCARRDRDARRPARRTRPRESPIRTDAPIPSRIRGAGTAQPPDSRPQHRGRVLPPRPRAEVSEGSEAPRDAPGRASCGRTRRAVSPALTPPPVRETRARATRARPYRFLPLALTEKRPPTGFNTLQTRLLPQAYGRVPQRNPASAAGVRPHPLLRAWPRRLKTPWSAWIIDSRCPSLRRSRCLLGRLLSLGAGLTDRRPRMLGVPWASCR